MKQILGFVDTDNNISRSLKHQRHKIKAALKNVESQELKNYAIPSTLPRKVDDIIDNNIMGEM